MSEGISAVLTLAHLSAMWVAQTDLTTDICYQQHFKTNQVNIIEQVLKQPSTVTVAILLFQEHSLKEIDTACLPFYDINFPVHDLLAEITNHSNGTEASVSRDISVMLAFLFLKIFP